MKYDDASWHYNGDFPENISKEAASTHIAMFVIWCLLNGLTGEIYTDEIPEQLEKLKNRIQTPGQWFIENCDEKFTNEVLNEVGNKFATIFYASDDAEYLNIYEKVLGENLGSLYSVPDNWESYDKLAPYIDIKFKQWSSKNWLTRRLSVIRNAWRF
ncbi:hypothetical protein C4G66_RS25190 [Vibrio parahaemolyticus]|nr:hypothetical protein [Vibrio parahaemolyticus]EJG0990175.1 hypothetical protein [Vibrio parahaemolyticus]EJG1072259.1 hypothetical protein [Vibrio parahaemolyticus]ELA8113184.1 hypothetical protein [Vibrio parahaemolyticus]ELA8166990.1 hypothetical protein [Vibrio parahaemolyticus]